MLSLKHFCWPVCNTKAWKCQGLACHQRNSKHFPLPRCLGLAYPSSSSSIPLSMQAPKRRSLTMAQECCTSCDSPLVAPYLSPSPDKNPPMTSCSFLFILLFAFGTLLSSWDPRRDVQKASPTPNRNAIISAFCLEMGACKRQWCKENQSARAVPPILSQPSLLFLSLVKPKEFSLSLS